MNVTNDWLKTSRAYRMDCSREFVAVAARAIVASASNFLLPCIQLIRDPVCQNDREYRTLIGALPRNVAKGMG